MTSNLLSAIRQPMNYVIGLKAGGGLRQTSAMLDQSHYVNQLACAVGGVLVFVAKSEWRGGDQKKMEKVEFDMPMSSCCRL